MKNSLNEIFNEQLPNFEYSRRTEKRLVPKTHRAFSWTCSENKSDQAMRDVLRMNAESNKFTYYWPELKEEFTLSLYKIQEQSAFQHNSTFIFVVKTRRPQQEYAPDTVLLNEIDWEIGEPDYFDITNSSFKSVLCFKRSQSRLHFSINYPTNKPPVEFVSSLFSKHRYRYCSERIGVTFYLSLATAHCSDEGKSTTLFIEFIIKNVKVNEPCSQIYLP